MSAVPNRQPQSNDDDEQSQPWPLTPELIGDINGLTQHALNAAQKREHSRQVAGLRAKHQSGCIVTVVDADGSVRFYQVKQFIIGPTE